MSVKIIDHSSRFAQKVEKVIDKSLAIASQEIEVNAKMHVPIKKGQLQSSISHKRVKQGHWKVVADKEYASYQERGMRSGGTRRVQHYSTSGTGKDFMKNAGKKVAQNFSKYFKEASGIIK